jgi:hypothetical protein
VRVALETAATHMVEAINLLCMAANPSAQNPICNIQEASRFSEGAYVHQATNQETAVSHELPLASVKSYDHQRADSLETPRSPKQSLFDTSERPHSFGPASQDSPMSSGHKRTKSVENPLRKQHKMTSSVESECQVHLKKGQTPTGHARAISVENHQVKRDQQVFSQEISPKSKWPSADNSPRRTNHVSYLGLATESNASEIGNKSSSSLNQPLAESHAESIKPPDPNRIFASLLAMSEKLKQTIEVIENVYPEKEEIPFLNRPVALSNKVNLSSPSLNQSFSKTSSFHASADSIHSQPREQPEPPLIQPEPLGPTQHTHAPPVRRRNSIVNSALLSIVIPEESEARNSYGKIVTSSSNMRPDTRRSSVSRDTSAERVTHVQTRRGSQHDARQERLSTVRKMMEMQQEQLGAVSEVHVNKSKGEINLSNNHSLNVYTALSLKKSVADMNNEISRAASKGRMSETQKFADNVRQSSDNVRQSTVISQRQSRNEVNNSKPSGIINYNQSQSANISQRKSAYEVDVPEFGIHYSPDFAPDTEQVEVEVHDYNQMNSQDFREMNMTSLQQKKWAYERDDAEFQVYSNEVLLEEPRDEVYDYQGEALSEVHVASEEAVSEVHVASEVYVAPGTQLLTPTASSVSDRPASNDSLSKIQLKQTVNKLEKRLKHQQVKSKRFESDIGELREMLTISMAQISELNTTVDGLQKQLGTKVGASTLTEFARHVSTMKDVKKTYKSLEKRINARMKDHMEQLLDQLEKVVGSTTDENVTAHLTASITKLSHWMGEKIKKEVGKSREKKPVDQKKVVGELKQWTRGYLKDLISQASSATLDTNIAGSQENMLKTDLGVPNCTEVARLARDVDDKLYTLSTELSACKSLFARQGLQPFYRCAQWIWNTGLLKHESAVPWTMETVNTGKYDSS